MIFRAAIATACAAAGLLVALPASAACTVKGALSIPVTMRGPRALVSLKINGQEGHFFIDSGSAFNGISSKFAAAQKLKPIAGGGEGQTRVAEAAGANITGVAGQEVRNGWVLAPQVEFVGATFKNLAFLATDRITDQDGIIGQPMLKQYDVEYDLKDSVIRLVKTDGCKNADITYWATPGTPYSKIPLDTTDQRDRPMTKAIVFVNGVKMRATFDTGAPYTFITEKAAARSGVKITDPEVTPVGEARGLDGAVKAWVGVFKSVKLGDEEIKDAPLEIGASDADFDMLIGADFFLSHHVYVANGQDNIYFAYTGGPVFRARRPPPTAAAK